MTNTAEMILEQLGGNRFLVMTGSRVFSKGQHSLHLKLAPNKSGADRLTITINSLNLYMMQFRKGTGESVFGINGILLAQLKKIFTENTGFYITTI